MVSPKEIQQRFYVELLKKKKAFGSGFNKFLCGETGLSSGHISSILKGNQAGSQDAHIKISEACGIDYNALLIGDGNSTPQDHTEWKIANYARKFECKQLVCDLLERLLSLENRSTIEFAKMVGKIDDEITKLSADEKKPASEDRHVSGE